MGDKPGPVFTLSELHADGHCMETGPMTFWSASKGHYSAISSVAVDEVKRDDLLSATEVN